MNQFSHHSPPTGAPMPPHGPTPGDGKATAALVLGILALLFPGFGMILGIIGIIMAMGARKEGFVGGKATAGLVLSIIAVAISGLTGICVSCMFCPALCMGW